jgi:hypothetical protein
MQTLPLVFSQWIKNAQGKALMKPASITILQGKMERKMYNRPTNNSSFQSLVKNHFQYLDEDFCYLVTGG